MSDTRKKSIRILVVEDNDTMREGIVQVLLKGGYDVTEASEGVEGLTRLQEEKIDLVITDYKMAKMDGLELLNAIKAQNPEIEVIVMTAYGTIDLAVNAMKAGAWDFLAKPISKDELRLKVDRASEFIHGRLTVSRLTEENRYLKEEVDVRFNYGEIVGESAKMRKIYRMIEKVAKNDTSVLIHGESGTGKELVARAIHFNSSREDRAFIRVNCGVLAEGVLESELFGHERGAFTNALRRKKGRFELADRGTLFLDEIGDIPLGTQVKLLRVLQEKEFERVGGEETLSVDVRLIAATHRNLLKEVHEGRFREDLYYRLYILPIDLPPLRQRKEDIPLLVKHFLQKLSQEMKKPEVHLSDTALEALIVYDWPGNIRELANVLERAVVLSEADTIGIENLGFIMKESNGTMISEKSMNLDIRLAAMEKHLLEQALKATNGVKAKAARLLGIKEGALYYKLQKYGLLEER